MKDFGSSARRIKSKYSAFNATQQMGQKTNNIVQVI